MSLVLADRTTWTRAGSVDLVLLDRFLAGADVVLTPAEREVAVHALAARGVGPAATAERLHEHTRATAATLTRPAPVDRLGRPFNLNPQETQ